MSYIKITRKQADALLYVNNRYLMSLRRRGKPTKSELLKAVELEKIIDKITLQIKLFK